MMKRQEKCRSSVSDNTLISKSKVCGSNAMGNSCLMDSFKYDINYSNNEELTISIECNSSYKYTVCLFSMVANG